MTGQEMAIDLIIPRVAASDTAQPLPVLTAINAAIEYVGQYLIRINSDLVQATFFDNTTEQDIALPPDYAGLKGKPLCGSRRLEPLSSRERWIDASKGLPQEYEIKGDGLYLYPSPGSSVPISFEYFAATEQLASIGDDVPFNSRFDQVIADIAVKISNFGIGILCNKSFEAEMSGWIDRIVAGRRQALHARRPIQFF